MPFQWKPVKYIRVRHESRQKSAVSKQDSRYGHKRSANRFNQPPGLGVA